MQRFLCDEMLGRLARWLRAAGYDVAMGPPGGGDDALLAQARAEGRMLLTRDRALAGRAEAGRGGPCAVRVIFAEHVEQQAREITASLGIDWLAAPFRRCLDDNAVLEAASETDLRDARRQFGMRGITPPYTVCPRCGKVYWVGGHVRRMRATLERWAGQQQDPDPDSDNPTEGPDRG